PDEAASSTVNRTLNPCVTVASSLCTLGERMTRDGSARSKQPAQFFELLRFGLLVVFYAGQPALAINQEDGGRVVHCIAARCRHLRVEHVIGARDQCDVLRTA